MKNLTQALRKYFGFSEFRTGQKEVVSAVMNGQDTLAILPTGTGKSLCYQLSGYLLDGLVLVVSPLISLMEDQVASLQRQGEKRVIALNSLLAAEEKEFVLQHLMHYKFLFVSPEILQNPKVVSHLQQRTIALLVVDEAHCVSQWGIDFRPEYRQLGVVKAQLESPVTLALTATATQAVQEDIADLLLDSKKVQRFVYSMDRANIALFVETFTEDQARKERLREVLHMFAGSGLIYCATRKKVEELYQMLRSEFSVAYYHGGLPSNQRRVLQQQFLNGQLQFLIATNAFGMGINKEDIRLVLHYELPDSLENYVQEIGRAGRDGKQSCAVLFYQSADERIHWYFQENIQSERKGLERLLMEDHREKSPLQEKWLNQMTPGNQQEFLTQLHVNEKTKKQKLQEMLAYINNTGCRRSYLLHYFQEELLAKPKLCCDTDGAKLPSKTNQQILTSENDTSWEDILLKLFKERQ